MSTVSGQTATVAESGNSHDFSRVHGDERARLGLDPDLRILDGVGLAFSGGGIRSASFALGVIQVLLNEGLLKHMDYLSTVSGGGYLGSAVSWWLHQAATDPMANAAKRDETAPTAPTTEGELRYEAFRRQFGSKVQGARTVGRDSEESLWSASNWLAYIRQHGNYLQPRGVGYVSLAATILRVCFNPLSVYGAALIALLCLFRAAAGSWGFKYSLEMVGLGYSLIAAGLFVLTAWLYGPATWFASLLGGGVSTWLYRQRTNFRRYSGTLLSLTLVALLLASVPALYTYIEQHIEPWVASASSLGLGTLGTIYQFLKGRAKAKSPSWRDPIRLIVTAALVIYGLLLGAYALAYTLTDPLLWGGILLASSAFFGLLLNTNYAGLARLYRDRLMEAFLPNLSTVASNEWRMASEADSLSVSALEGRLERDGKLARKINRGCPRPLQLINCNAVLMDSSQDLYRNRGGDNFAISPLWSGSNATGWIPTKSLGDGSVSLATAMSISGAAANPNAAPNGLGITRNRLVSFLLSLFNVRLGYWMANPVRADKSPSNKPNLWFPGFRQGLLGRGLNENASFLELTDGGHFDNTALYELIRRRTKLIIVAMGSCDPEFAMEDLANLIEKVRVDFSVFIEFGDEAYPLDALRPKGAVAKQPSTRGFALGRVRYPKGTPTSPDYDDGIMVYLQAVPTASMPSDVTSYWRRNESFPNDTTADQFFSEQNLEAYRELGYTVAGQFYHTANASAPDSKALQSIQATLNLSILTQRPLTPTHITA